LQVRALPGAPSIASYELLTAKFTFLPVHHLKENIHGAPFTMPEVRTVHRSSSVVRLILAVYALVGGLVSFFAYVADVPRLADWSNAGISIQPNAAIAVMSAALAVLLLSGGYTGAARLLGVLVAAIGGTVLLQYASGIDLGIDNLFLFGRTWGNSLVLVPGRMGPPGAVSWTMIGLAIVLASVQSRQWPRAVAPGVALIATAIASLSLIGYLYGASALYTVPSITVIALQTSTFILANSLAVVLSLPEHAPVRLLEDETAAGALTRRVLPAVIVVPIVLGVLRLWGEQAGFYDLAFGTSIRTLAEIVLMSGLLWWAANTISRQAHARQLAEDQLLESLRDADRRKNKFLATLAHELRNPLAPVRNAVALLKSRTQPDPLVNRVSEVIERQVSLMARLMDDLLDIGRITNDRLELRRERVDLVAIVRDAVDMCQPMIQRSGHEISVMAPQPSIVVEADPTRLGQVFGNLVNNACRYMAAKGQLWVTIERTGSAAAVVTITDTGMGIPPEQLSSIFEMFSQVDRTNRPHGGLGIGLHLVKRLVEMHGGQVSAHSDGPGLGSRFTVRLPALPESVTIEPVPKPLPTPSEPRVSRRVLVVDDNTDNAELLKILLEEEGHETFMAHDGVEGLAAAERLRPDVVLMDLGLPRIDGFDACRRIREQPWGKQMLMIAITGWGQDVDRRKSQEAGFDHHLVKPVDANDISALMCGSAAVGQQP
jgi:signal transduction histidine kinase/CheY-like chemotaxis protein